MGAKIILENFDPFLHCWMREVSSFGYIVDWECIVGGGTVAPVGAARKPLVERRMPKVSQHLCKLVI